jgi:hypothetical protein
MLIKAAGDRSGNPSQLALTAGPAVGLARPIEVLKLHGPESDVAGTSEGNLLESGGRQPGSGPVSVERGPTPSPARAAPGAGWQPEARSRARASGCHGWRPFKFGHSVRVGGRWARPPVGMALFKA